MTPLAFSPVELPPKTAAPQLPIVRRETGLAAGAVSSGVVSTGTMALVYVEQIEYEPVHETEFLTGPQDEAVDYDFGVDVLSKASAVEEATSSSTSRKSPFGF